MVLAFPLAKLGFLLMKQLSKPIANIIKNEAKNHPFFRKYVCIPPGRAYHWVEMQTKLHVKGRWKPVTVVPITEEEAVDLGASLIGEITLLTLLSGIIILEVNRQGEKKAEKEKLKEDEIINLIETVIGIMEDVETLKNTVEQLKADVGAPHKLDFSELEELRNSLAGITSSASQQKQHKMLDEPSGDPRSPSPNL